jgi:hypothetical protein
MPLVQLLDKPKKGRGMICFKFGKNFEVGKTTCENFKNPCEVSRDKIADIINRAHEISSALKNIKPEEKKVQNKISTEKIEQLLTGIKKF